MNVEEAIRQRRTIRRFTDEPVSAVDIRALLDLATQAPNVANRQMWRFIVITTPEFRKMLADLVRYRIDEMMEWPELSGQATRLQAWREQAGPFSEAPALILFVNQGYRTALDTALVERGMKHWEVAGLFGHPDIQSVSAAVAFLVLAAGERGYGACWMTAPLLAKRDLQTALEFKPGEDIIAIVALGRPEEKPLPKQRKKIDEITEWR